ncbi:MAG: hypothetical protein JXK16_04045 [Thiotrichales bacterium]|nr:hypothetical protein [Thiotrichales bacterium]
MAKFNHLSALEHLLKMDTNIFKEELYYPWYAQHKNIQIVIAGWIAGLLIFIGLLLGFTSVNWVVPIVIGFVLSVIFAGGYFVMISHSKKSAQNECLKQMMALEKNQFMKNIEPFVGGDQKTIVKRIATHVDFSPNEYISLAVATKSRAIFDTDGFIKDIERMFADESITPANFDDEGYSDTVFKVPAKAKKNYEKMKNKSTFSDELHITPQAQAAILAKVRDAANRKALGREA